MCNDYEYDAICTHSHNSRDVSTFYRPKMEYECCRHANKHNDCKFFEQKETLWTILKKAWNTLKKKGDAISSTVDEKIESAKNFVTSKTSQKTKSNEF